MKKRLVMLWLPAVLLLAAGCSKETELTGTSWYGSFQIQVEVSGYGQLDLLSEYTLVFESGTEGHILMKGTLTKQGATVYTEGKRSNFAYTFDGEEGELTLSDGKTNTFAYSKEGPTITVPVMSEEALDHGVTHIVFRPME